MVGILCLEEAEKRSDSRISVSQDGPTVEAVLQLAPSLTGAVGYITRRSLELVKTFREGSPRSFFVVVSGARARHSCQGLPMASPLAVQRQTSPGTA